MSEAAKTSPKPSWLRRVATPSSIAVFTVLAVTGILLFFHLAERQVKELHEWIGMVFVAVSLLHIARNWPAYRAHLKGRALWIATALVLSGTAAMVVPTLQESEERGGGLRAVLGALTRASLQDLAPALGTEPEALVAKLKAAGFPSAAADKSIEEIAEADQKPPRAALEAVAPEPPPEGEGPKGPPKRAEG